jgi:hypothetical protein
VARSRRLRGIQNVVVKAAIWIFLVLFVFSVVGIAIVNVR